MKKIISFLMCVMIICSVSLTGFAAGEANMPLTVTPSKTTLEAGEAFTVTITTNSTVDYNFWGGGFYLAFNPDVVERVPAADVKSMIGTTAVFDGIHDITNNADNVFMNLVATEPKEFTTVVTLGFKVKDGVTSGTSNFDLTIDTQNGSMVGPNGDYYEDITAYTLTNGSITVGSTPVPPVVEEKFEISATTDGGNVVVTAENIDKAVGEEIKVYVATYASGVLVNCQEQALKEGAMTFTGLADASARVFVWDKYNVPVADVTIQ